MCRGGTDDVQAEAMTLVDLLQEYERALIVVALGTCGGHQRQAARLLGLLPTTLSEKMRRHGLRARRADFVAHLPAPQEPARIMAEKPSRGSGGAGRLTARDRLIVRAADPQRQALALS